MDKKLYRETFSQLHADLVINEEWFTMKKRRPRGLWKRTAVLAAAIAALLCCALTAYAVYQYSLGDLSVGKHEVHYPNDPSDPSLGQHPEMVEMITLAGFQGSPEYQAAMEWLDYTEHYDIVNGGTPLGGESAHYAEYNVCTREAALALEAIADKYGLKLARDSWVAENRELMIQELGSDFFPGIERAGGGYILDSGTFHVESEIPMENGDWLDFQFGFTAKGYVDDVILVIGDMALYEQWQYQTNSGVTVLMALSGHKGLVYADLAHGFVLINVLEGTDTGATKADLEQLADGIDWVGLNAYAGVPPRPDVGELWKVGEFTGRELEEGKCPEVMGFLGNWVITDTWPMVWGPSLEEREHQIGYTITYATDHVTVNGVVYGNVDCFEITAGYTRERLELDYRVVMRDNYDGWWPVGKTMLYHGTIMALEGDFGTYFFTDGQDTLWIYYEACLYRAERTREETVLPEPDPADWEAPEYCGLWTPGELADGLGGDAGNFMGQWVIKEAKYCRVSELAQEAVESLLGTTISYTKEGIIRNDEWCTTVTAFEVWSGYTPGRILLDYKADLSDWWIRIGRMYSVNTASVHLPFGGDFFYDGNNALWIYCEGVFFRCERA